MRSQASKRFLRLRRSTRRRTSLLSLSITRPIMVECVRLKSRCFASTIANHVATSNPLVYGFLNYSFNAAQTTDPPPLPQKPRHQIRKIPKLKLLHDQLRSNITQELRTCFLRWISDCLLHFWVTYGRSGLRGLVSMVLRLGLQPAPPDLCGRPSVLS